MPTLPDEFQIPEPGKKAEVPTVRYVVEAFVAVRLVTFPVVPQKVGKVAYVVEAE